MRMGALDRLITFQSPVAAQGFRSAGKGGWADFAVNVWAEVQDMLPSRGERLTDGLKLALRPARIRIRYRPDITSDMQVIYGARTMQIMGPPIEIGRRDWLEMMAQDYSTSGGGN